MKRKEDARCPRNLPGYLPGNYPGYLPGSYPGYLPGDDSGGAQRSLPMLEQIPFLPYFPSASASRPVSTTGTEWLVAFFARIGGNAGLSRTV